MKNTLLCLILLASLSSCSMLQKREIDYSEAYVTGKGTENKSSEEVESNLLREISMAGGNYEIKAFPITTAYINATANETIAVKNLSERSSKKLKKELSQKYIDRKACINTKITVKEFQQVSKLENWKLVLIDSNNIAYQLFWQPEPPTISKLPESIISTRQSYHGKEEMWHLAGISCAEADLELKKGFKVVFKASFVQWPFDDEATEEWSFDYTEVIEGKKIFKKKKEKQKKRYRGW